MGYSMGARITAFLALAHPARVRSAIFGGLGGNMVRPMAGTGPIAHALEAASIDDVKNPTARTFRAFAEKTGSDLKALAACIRGSREPLTREMVGTHRLPGSGRHRHRGRHRRARRGARSADPRRRGPADPAPRPHAGRRRQGLQGRRARVPAAPAVEPGKRPFGKKRLPQAVGSDPEDTRKCVTGLADSEMQEPHLRVQLTHFRATSP